MDVLVAYDIDTHTRVGQRRLSRVTKVWESYGSRVQYSVFECRVSEAGLEHMTSELLEEIDTLSTEYWLSLARTLGVESPETLGVRGSSDARTSSDP